MQCRPCGFKQHEVEWEGVRVHPSEQYTAGLTTSIVGYARAGTQGGARPSRTGLYLMSLNQIPTGCVGGAWVSVLFAVKLYTYVHKYVCTER